MLQTCMYENQTATPNQHKEYVNYDCRLHNTTALKPWLFMALKEFMCRQAIFIYSLFTVNVDDIVRIFEISILNMKSVKCDDKIR